MKTNWFSFMICVYDKKEMKIEWQINKTYEVKRE